MTDQEIFRKLKMGDKDTYKEQYLLYQNEFTDYFRKAYHFLRYEEIEGLYQESWVAIVVNIQNKSFYELTSKFKTYLFKVGINQAKTLIRKKNKKRDALGGIKKSLQEDEKKNTIGEFDKEDIKSRIEKIVEKIIKEKMTETCKNILIPFYIEGKKYNEILRSKSNNFYSIDALKTYKSRCMKHLEDLVRDILGKQGLI